MNCGLLSPSFHLLEFCELGKLTRKIGYEEHVVEAIIIIVGVVTVICIAVTVPLNSLLSLFLF